MQIDLYMLERGIETYFFKNIFIVHQKEQKVKVMSFDQNMTNLVNHKIDIILTFVFSLG